jgi:hypothetical protein
MKTKRLRIGSHEWKVKFQSKVRDDDGTPLNGITHNDNRTIYIDSTMTQDNQGLILFHESLHAALFECGLDELVTPQMEEALVRGLSNTLWPLVRTNKFLK